MARLSTRQANPFKKALVASKLPDGSSTTVYRCGPFIDLCKGPHLPSTGCVKAFKLTKNSTAHWLGQAGNDELQRVYGISFPDKKELRAWERLQASFPRPHAASHASPRQEGTHYPSDPPLQSAHQPLWRARRRRQRSATTAGSACSRSPSAAAPAQAACVTRP